MALLTVTSPHAHNKTQTSWVMQQVLLATIPGVFALTYFFGFGTLINIFWCSLVAMLSEAVTLYIRKKPILFYLKDYSAIVTAVLLAIALPPYSPWWLSFIGVSFAIIIAKQLYGGLGYNPFNPAMVAYVILLISLPVQMTQWAAPVGIAGVHHIGLLEAFGYIFLGNPMLDGITMATPLDLMKQNDSLLMGQFFSAYPQLGQFAGLGWEWVNAGFLLGGIYLLVRKIFTWHTPISFLIALALCSLIGYDFGSAHSGGSPLFHLFSGATMFCAFFIATDPVSSAVSTRGRIAFGACIGILVYIIRVYGSYPDAVAFSVLLMNFAAPFIDHYTKPRPYGHGK